MDIILLIPEGEREEFKMRFRKVSLRLIRRVIQQIVQAVHPKRIILFGSYANGRPGPDSDVDLLVVMNSRKRPAQRATDVSKTLRLYPFPMDIIVRTPQEVQKRLHIGDPFFQEILRRGKVLYEQ